MHSRIHCPTDWEDNERSLDARVNGCDGARVLHIDGNVRHANSDGGGIISMQPT